MNTVLQTLFPNKWEQINLDEVDSEELNRPKRGAVGVAVAGVGLAASAIAIYEFVIKRFDVTDNGRTSLHIAAKMGELEYLKHSLITERINVDAQDNLGNTALHYAAANGKLNIVSYLMNTAKASFKVNSAGADPLHFAAIRGDVPIVKYFVETSRSNIYAGDNQGLTAVHFAAHCNKLNLIRYLAPKYSNISLRNHAGASPLAMAAYGGALDVVKYFVAERPALFNMPYFNGRSPLIYAAYGGQIPVVRYLLDERHESLNQVDNAGTNALHYAAIAGQAEMLRYLVEQRHADINARDSKGGTPLGYAKAMMQTSAAQYLESKGGRERRSIRSAHETSEALQPAFPVLTEHTNSISSDYKAAIDMECTQTSNHSVAFVQNTDIKSWLLLIDTLVRKFTHQKLISTADQPSFELEKQVYASMVVDGFEDIVWRASEETGLNLHRLNIDFEQIRKDVISNFPSADEIANVLMDRIERACPGREAGCPGKLSPRKYNQFLDLLSVELKLYLTRFFLIERIS